MCSERMDGGECLLMCVDQTISTTELDDEGAAYGVDDAGHCGEHYVSQETGENVV